MYNRYIPSGTSYTRIVEEDAPPVRTEAEAPPPQNEEPAAPEAPSREETSQSEEKKGGLAKLFKGLKLDSLDTGDILLLLILLFLFLEGDDMEIIITLGLLLLLGLD